MMLAANTLKKMQYRSKRLCRLMRGKLLELSTSGIEFSRPRRAFSHKRGQPRAIRAMLHYPLSPRRRLPVIDRASSVTAQPMTTAKLQSRGDDEATMAPIVDLRLQLRPATGATGPLSRVALEPAKVRSGLSNAGHSEGSARVAGAWAATGNIPGGASKHGSHAKASAIVNEAGRR